MAQQQPQPLQVQVAGEVNRMIQSEVSGIYSRLERLRQQARFPSFDTVNIPMVLVLGNHSSGKSTFINHMLQQQVQKAGRAPTDCTFTVLVGGNREERLDGAALARHRKYGFGDIQRLFGREFVSQIELKVVENCPLLNESGMMIVDSPGMIDPPGGGASLGAGSINRRDTNMDRGYDFKRVVQWFADRSDVILVMFDPDKPGTTFETLDVLTSSLRDFSSKVLLIMNKVDDFMTVHDFARAYGALCWNLSKVIPRKDLPLIYTMYVPIEHRANGNQEKLQGNGLEIQRVLEREFDGTRVEVIREVQRAPDRATDNILNLLKSTMSRLKMHCKLLEACKKELVDMDTLWKQIRMAGIIAGAGAVAFYLIRSLGRSSPPMITNEASASSPMSGTSIATSESTPEWKRNWARQVARSRSSFSFVTFFKVVSTSVLSNLALWRVSLWKLTEKREKVLEWLPTTFSRVYAPHLFKTDRQHDEILMTWRQVQPGLEMAIRSCPLDEFPVFSHADKSFLDDVLGIHVARLDSSVRDRGGDDHAYLRYKHTIN